MKKQVVNSTGILVAVYGSLRKNFHNHSHYLSNAKFLGEATTEPKYTLLDLGSFPAVIEEGNTPIKVEVYEVTAEEKQSIDCLEGYRPGRKGGLYDVTTINTPYGEATMYVMEVEQGRNYSGRPAVESGDWADRKERSRY